jgi:hypothetical protein
MTEDILKEKQSVVNNCSLSASTSSTRGPWADRSRQGKKPEFEMSLLVPSTHGYA